ncbi:MAG: universal stress protein [Bacillales bacterium]|nr:universal stress protein [Bacillales bacterium]
MFNKILLASDGSEHSLRATEKAIVLCENNPNASITVVYVVDTATAKTDVLSEGNLEDRELMRKHRLAPTEKLISAANIPHDIKLIKGEPGPSIVTFSNENNFDIVVIGSCGLNGLQEMVLGSVSHKVAKRAIAPVLIVK